MKPLHEVLADMVDGWEKMRRDLQGRNTELVLANRNLKAAIEELLRTEGCGCCADDGHYEARKTARALLEEP